MSMPILMVAALVMTGLLLAVGFAAGWFSRGKGAAPDGPTPEALAEAKQREKEVDQARSLLADVQNLAADMRSDVGQHATRVERISKELADAQDGGPGDGAAVGDAVRQILESNGELNRRLREAEKKLAEQAVQIKTHETASLTDQLTGVPNRRAFDRHLAERISDFQKVAAPASLIMIDIDFFKKFNDTHGHHAGDAVLKGVAKTISKALRENDVVARFGGEEFGIVLPQTTLSEACPVVERVRKAVEGARFQCDGKLLNCTISLGLAQFGKEDTDELFVRRADDALYAAKKGGRNRGYLHNGQECVPVAEPGQNAAPSGELNNAQLVERRKFSLKQRVAPYSGGNCPSQDKFVEVHCRDLSSDGLSFYSTNPVAWEQAVIELGAAPSLTYFAARVEKVEPIAADMSAGYRVECRFVNRIAGPSATAAATLAPVAVPVDLTLSGPSVTA